MDPDFKLTLAQETCLRQFIIDLNVRGITWIAPLKTFDDPAWLPQAWAALRSIQSELFQQNLRAHGFPIPQALLAIRTDHRTAAPPFDHINQSTEPVTCPDCDLLISSVIMLLHAADTRWIAPLPPVGDPERPARLRTALNYIRSDAFQKNAHLACPNSLKKIKVKLQPSAPTWRQPPGPGKIPADSVYPAVDLSNDVKALDDSFRSFIAGARKGAKKVRDRNPFAT